MALMDYFQNLLLILLLSAGTLGLTHIKKVLKRYGAMLVHSAQN